MSENVIERTSGQQLNPPQDTDKMNSLVGYILLVGVSLSALLIIAGSLWNWASTRSLTTRLTISGVNYFGFLISDFRQLFAGQIKPPLLISLGIAVLMATPYIRVGASAVYFALVAHNLKYTLFTLFVFAVLTYSLFLR